MADYRIYKLISGGHINAPAIVICHDTDAQAVAHARQLIAGACELWRGEKCILRQPVAAQLVRDSA